MKTDTRKGNGNLFTPSFLTAHQTSDLNTQSHEDLGLYNFSHANKRKVAESKLFSLRNIAEECAFPQQ